MALYKIHIFHGMAVLQTEFDITTDLNNVI